MKKKIMNRIIVILSLIVINYTLYSQEPNTGKNSVSDCQPMIREAGRLYFEGLYDKCINILETVLKTCDLAKDDHLLSLELLAKAYVEVNDLGKAESMVDLLLGNDPHYELNEEDNPEAFNRLVRKFKIHPQFSIGIRNTAGWINYKTTDIFSYNGIRYDEPYNKELEGILHGFGLMYYGWAEYEFDRGISINGDLIFKWTKFRRDLKEAPPYNLSFNEQDNFLEIPIYLKKYFQVGRNTLPYITAGIGWLFMTKSNGNATIYYPANDSTSFMGSINMLEMRNRHNFEWIIGAGIGYKLKNLRLFVDIRYYGGLNSITKPEKIIHNSSLLNDYYYLDNYVKINQFEVGASASYTLFNSVKRNRH